MSKNITIKVEAPTHRNPVVVAMNARYGGKGGRHTNQSAKRTAQKERRVERNAW